MFRILKCDKDTYITNKIIHGTSCSSANTGQAGTIDFFKLYNETSPTSGIELTRGLIHFDLNPIRALTSSFLNISDPSFKCYLELFDVYGGQTTPSNFSLFIHPLARNFSEGSGMDVIGFQDNDVANWLTASLGGNTWVVSGCLMTGNIGDTNIDYYISGVLDTSSVSLGRSQTFSIGNENLNIDITDIISGTIAGRLPDYGFRISFSETEETDSSTRFVKRFSSRHSKNHFKHPRLIVKYNESFIDQKLNYILDNSGTIAIYNSYFGNYRNFFSSSVEITGSNCLLFELHTSKSVVTATSSWSSTHSQSINHLTSSYVYFSASFSGSQREGYPGFYYSETILDSNNPDLQNCLDKAKVKFLPLWKSLDGNILYSSGSYFEAHSYVGENTNVAERNFIVNIQNLKQLYVKEEISRLRVFIQDYNTDFEAYFLPIETQSKIYKTMHWRLIESFTKQVIIPFDLIENSTLLSSDGKGMYFDMYFEDLIVNNVYEFEFLIREIGQDYITTNQGFKFKVIN